MTEHDYIQRLVAELGLVTAFRVPCDGHPHGHFADLHVTKRVDGHGDGWAITNLDGQAWTGTCWQHRGVLARSEIYRFTRDQALEEAQRIAPLETSAFRALLAAAHTGQEHRHG